MAKKISNVVCCVLVLYFLLCWGEIIVKNTRPNPEYSNYNVIVRMTTGGDAK